MHVGAEFGHTVRCIPLGAEGPAAFAGFQWPCPGRMCPTTVCGCGFPDVCAKAAPDEERGDLQGHATSQGHIAWG